MEITVFKSIQFGKMKGSELFVDERELWNKGDNCNWYSLVR